MLCKPLSKCILSKTTNTLDSTPLRFVAGAKSRFGQTPSRRGAIRRRRAVESEEGVARAPGARRSLALLGYITQRAARGSTVNVNVPMDAHSECGESKQNNPNVTSLRVWLHLRRC